MVESPNAGRRAVLTACLLMFAVLLANAVLYPASVLLVFAGAAALAFALERVDLVLWAIILATPLETFGPVTFLMTKSVKLALAMLVVGVLYWRSASAVDVDPYRGPFLLIAFSGFFSTLLAQSPWTSLTGLLSILIFVFFYRSLRLSRLLAGRSESILMAVLWMGVFCSVLCVAQLLFGYEGIIGSPEQRAMQAEGVMDTFWPGIERGAATLNGPSAAGAFCAIAGVVALAGALAGKSRLQYLSFTALCAAGVLATFSRGALLGLITGSGIALWAMGVLSKKRLWLIAAVAIPLITISFAAEDVRNYLRLGTDLVSVSESRVDAWQATRTILARHPVFGIGFYEFREFAQGIEGVSDTPLHPHNGFLKALVETGPIGGLGYLLYIASFFRTASRATRENRGKNQLWVHGAIAGVGASLFTQELFDANLTIGGSSIAILFAILLALQASEIGMARESSSVIGQLEPAT